MTTPIKIFILCTAMSLWAFGDADGPDFFMVRGVAADDTLSLRAKGTHKAHKIADLPYNATCLQNLGCEGGSATWGYMGMSAAQRKKIERQHPMWCKVKYRGIVGWVGGSYVTEGEPCNTPVTKDTQTKQGNTDPLSVKDVISASAKTHDRLQQNMPYSQARKLLLNAGWQGKHTRWQDAPKSGEGKEVYHDNGWDEIQDCAGTGMGFCRFEFTDIKGRTLVVITAGECEKTTNIACEKYVYQWSLE